MHDLMKALIDGKKDVKSLPKSVCAKLSDFFECLKDIPILDVLKLIDDKKAQKILATLDKIVSLANLSQSMGNYFARDDSLDPALCVVCEGLRASTDFEDMLKLRGGTFQSLASAYHHLKATTDRDAAGRSNPRGGGGYRATNSRAQMGGFCFHFQRNSRCTKRDCTYVHRCSKCNRTDHGARECRSFGGL